VRNLAKDLVNGISGVKGVFFLRDEEIYKAGGKHFGKSGGISMPRGLNELHGHLIA
jgi:hypothetical protein